METKMNTIGIDDNLNRERIKKLLSFGVFASLLTGVGDFLLGYGAEEPATGIGATVMANAMNLAEWQLIAGALLGFFGIFLEGLSYFAVYRLMADASPRYAHTFRAGIFGYLWVAPAACHLNVGVLNLAYQYLLKADAVLAGQLADRLVLAFCAPAYVLLACFWIPMIIVQFKAFAKGLTPYPTWAKWFCMPIGMLPALIAALLIGSSTALGSAIGTMVLSFGNLCVFGGLLITLPSGERFAAFREGLRPEAGAGKRE